jgi:hypothetical protein
MLSAGAAREPITADRSSMTERRRMDGMFSLDESRSDVRQNVVRWLCEVVESASGQASVFIDVDETAPCIQTGGGVCKRPCSLRSARDHVN